MNTLQLRALLRAIADLAWLQHDSDPYKLSDEDRALSIMLARISALADQALATETEKRKA